MVADFGPLLPIRSNTTTSHESVGEREMEDNTLCHLESTAPKIEPLSFFHTGFILFIYI